MLSTWWISTTSPITKNLRSPLPSILKNKLPRTSLVLLSRPYLNILLFGPQLYPFHQLLTTVHVHEKLWDFLLLSNNLLILFLFIFMPDLFICLVLSCIVKSAPVAYPFHWLQIWLAPFMDIQLSFYPNILASRETPSNYWFMPYGRGTVSE